MVQEKKEKKSAVDVSINLTKTQSQKLKRFMGLKPSTSNATAVKSLVMSVVSGSITKGY